MTRRLTRSRAEQVAPDRMLYVREGVRYAVDSAPADAETTYPLLGRSGKPGIFDILKPQLKLSSDGFDVPTLYFGGRKIFGENKEGNPVPRSGQRVSSLLTFTTKMGAPSFGLPSGPTSEGGTCAAANFGKRGGKRTPGKEYICDTCYALEGRYVLVNIAIGQGARAWWVTQQLARDPSGARLAQQITAAITDYARFGSMCGLRGGLENRIIIELGIWKRGRIHVPMKHPLTSSISYTPAIETPLPASSGFTSSTQFFASRGVSEDQVVGFFRVHDSGDLNIGRGTAAWKGYLEAWTLIARALPGVVFWMPTRAWIFPRVRAMLVEASARAPNLIIRASALNIGDPAPSVPGLSAGSTVAEAVDKRTFITPPSNQRGAPYLCPVNTDWSWDPRAAPRRKRAGGELGAWVTKMSCQLAGCRVCWVAPELDSAYGEHK